MKPSLSYYNCPDFPHRYISAKKLFDFLQANLSDYISQVGTSVLGKPIYKMSIGNGPVKILAWSQMHGNESNATHAMLDLLESLKHAPEQKDELLKKISLDFIFMLNPDGAEKWTRRNALDIDMNRDFHKMASKELPILKKIISEKKYDYALNLHEQRTIFTTDGEHPATLSFLAPSENVEREVTETRKKCMAVISKIYEQMKNILPHGIARYTDEFYPSSAGDNFTAMGIPTILIEGGHFANDYLRKETRKFYTLALYEALKAMGDLHGGTSGWENYFQIPENRESHYDIIYRNVRLNTDFPCVLDVAVQFREVMKDGDEEISFVPIVTEVGDVGKRKGWKEIDCSGRKFVSAKKFPKLDSEVDFHFE